MLDRQALLLALVKAMQKEKQAQESNNRLLESHWGRRNANPISYPCWDSAQAVRALVSVRDEALREAEMTALSAAIEAAIEEYWEKLEAWLGRVVPDGLDEVVVSGGAALMMEPKLTHYFSDSNRERPFDGELVWDAGLKEMMEETFKWRFSQNPYQVARFADAYGLFDQMLDSVGAKS